MYQASAAFATAVRQSHTPIAKVDVHTPGGNVIASTDGGLLLVDGQIRVDRRAKFRRHLSATFIDFDGALTPMKGSPVNTEPMNPMNFYEFRPYRGIMYADGTTEYVPQGIYYISSESIEPNERGGYTLLRLELDDRSSIWSRNKYTKAVSFPRFASASSPPGVIKEMLNHSMPTWMATQPDWGPFFNVVSDTDVPPSYKRGDIKCSVGDDPWDTITKTCDAFAREGFFGRLGEFNAWQIFDPDTELPVVASYDEGTGGVFVTPPRRTIDMDDAYTGVVMKGSAPWLIYPVSAEVWDRDPRSFTFAGGKIGERPFIMEDVHVTNDGMASVAAQAAFKRNVGILENITFDLLPDPRLDVGDVIYVQSASSGVEGRYSIETLTFPLVGLGPMTGTTRRRRRT